MSYICDGCIGHWRSEKFMENCGICDGHKKMGWTPQQMLEVYEPMLKAREDFKLNTKIIPPCNERLFIGRSDPLSSHISYRTYYLASCYYSGKGLNEQQMIDLKKRNLWPLRCSTEQKNAFCEQEKDNLHHLYMSRRAWDLLDPISQKIVLFFV